MFWGSGQRPWSGSYRGSDLNSEVFLGNFSIIISADGQLVDTSVVHSTYNKVDTRPDKETLQFNTLLTQLIMFCSLT